MSAEKDYSVAVVGGIGLTSGSGVCFEHSEQDTVLIQVSRVPENATQDIVDSLVESLDTKDVVISASRRGSNLKMRVSPIDNVEDLTRRIQFGVVVKTEGRAISVEFADRRLWGCTTVILPIAG